MPRCGAGTGGSGGLASELGRADDDDYKPWIAGARRAPTGRGGLRGATITSTPLTTASGVHGRGVNVAAVLRNQAVPEPEHVAAGKASPPSRRVYCTSNSAINASPSLQTFSTSCRKPATEARNALTASTNADLPWTASALPRRRRTSSVMNAASAETSFESRAANIRRTWSVGVMTYDAPSCRVRRERGLLCLLGFTVCSEALGAIARREVSSLSRDDPLGSRDLDRASWAGRSGRAQLEPPRARCDQFASVPSKSIVACVPSQNGLFDECPQRHIAIGSGCSITCPSGRSGLRGPRRCRGRFRWG